LDINDAASGMKHGPNEGVHMNGVYGALIVREFLVMARI
jgi:hypothetical protein